METGNEGYASKKITSHDHYSYQMDVRDKNDSSSLLTNVRNNVLSMVAYDS